MCHPAALSLAALAGLAGMNSALGAPTTLPSTRPAPQWYQELSSSTTPAAESAPGLLAQLQAADPTQRETLIRYLLPMADVAAEPAVQLFANSRLSSRLSLLELLEAWGAPTADLDPWEPESITPERLQRLQAWAKSPEHSHPTTQPTRPAVSVTSELSRLATCESEAEATLIRERLARFGPSIRDAVLKALHDYEGDAAQTRLTAVRYRLVASDAVAIGWPDGLDRLSSRDPQVRRKAAQDLARRTSPAEVPLLRELFSDSDPFVRETSLNALQELSGDAARDALAQMLDDPDANVRTAVLKRLTEKPSAQFTNRLIEYARKEQDPDLVLHSVRALRSLKGSAAVQGLIELMRHPSWQVRAEAADGVKEAISRLSEDKKVDAYIAMVALLKDEDSFVVSRAVQCLQQADLATALEPLMEVADRRPELTSEVVKAISSGQNMKRLAPRYVRKFCSHSDPVVRASAIIGLCQIATTSVDQEVLKALRDPDARVRSAAAEALYGLIEDLRPFAPNVRLTSRSQYTVDDKKKAKPEAWVQKFQSGQDRPEWMLQAAQACREALPQANPEARVRLALPLLALEADPKAQEAILQAVREDGQLAGPAAHGLIWVPAPQRLEMSEQLFALTTDGEQQAKVVSILAIFSDDQAIGRLWKLLGDPKANLDLAASVYRALLTHYVGERYYDSSALAALDRKGIAAEVTPYAANGAELQRSVALGLLLLVSPAEAAIHAKAARLQPNASEWQRLDALQIQLLALPADQGLKEALAVMAGGDLPLRKVALPYLAGLRSQLQQLRGKLYIYSSVADRSDRGPDGKPVLPAYPEGLDETLLRDTLKTSPEDQVPMAAYLLALKGDRPALDSLIDSWRSRQERQLQWLVVRSIAVRGDDSLVPVLQEIYGTYAKDDYEIRDFYWTIRGMQGSNALKLRKQIRDEVGMNRLR